MSSVKIKCNDFADTMKEIINLVSGDSSSVIIEFLSNLSKTFVCEDLTEQLISNFSDDFSPEYQAEMKRLISECKDSICKNGDSEMTITCETIRIMLEDGEDTYNDMKKECQKVKEQLDANKDIVEIIFLLIGKEPFVNIKDDDINEIMNKSLPGLKSTPGFKRTVSQQPLDLTSVSIDNIDDIDLDNVMNQFNKKDVLDKLKTIDREKLTPIKQLLGLMVKCNCDNESSPKKKGLSTTVIIIIVVFVLLLLFLGMFFLYSRHKQSKSSYTTV